MDLKKCQQLKYSWNASFIWNHEFYVKGRDKAALTQLAKESGIRQIQDLEHARDFHDDHITHHDTNDDDTNNDCHSVYGGDYHRNMFITPPYIDLTLLH